jgi:hypothetical protein
MKFYYWREWYCDDHNKLFKAVYSDYQRGYTLMVLWPFNYAVELYYWALIGWQNYLGRESWLEDYLKRQCHITSQEYAQWRKEKVREAMLYAKKQEDERMGK